MEKTKILAAAFAALLLSGCGTVDPAQTVTANPVSRSVNLTEKLTAQTVTTQAPDDAFRNAHAQFALGLLQKTAEQNSGKNLLISPYSVMQALGMAANGAAGDTRACMEQTLGGLPVDRLNAYLASWRQNQPDTAGCQVSTANSVWYRSGFSVKPEFLQQTVDYYDAGAFVRDFSAPQTCDDVNKWIDKRTKHMIPRMLDSIQPESVMLLVNAVSFDAKWSEEYEPGSFKERAFYAADGTEQTVQMMYSTEYGLLSDGDAVGFMRPYSGGRYYFAALLPDENTSVENYLAGMTAERLRDVFRSADYSREVQAGLPKFSYEYGTDLMETLSGMGMALAGTPAADFSAMTDSTEPVYINKVLHRARIEVAEDGTKAAAATVAEMKCGAAITEIEPVYVILDRPFLFAIYDSQNELPVFLGVLNSVTE